MGDSLAEIYLKMLKFDNIKPMANGDISFKDSLFFEKNTTIQNSFITLSDLNLSNNLVSTKNITILNNLTAYNSIYISNLNTNDITVNNNCNISNNITCSNNQSTTLFANNISVLNNCTALSVITDNIYISSINSINLSINSNIISLSAQNINLNCTNLNLNASNINLKDKLITINYNNSNTEVGILIKTQNNNDGYILSKNNRYEIKVPNNTSIESICSLDLNNNLIISGTSIIQQNFTTNNISIEEFTTNVITTNTIIVSGPSLINNITSITNIFNTFVSFTNVQSTNITLNNSIINQDINCNLFTTYNLVTDTLTITGLNASYVNISNDIFSNDVITNIVNANNVTVQNINLNNAIIGNANIIQNASINNTLYCNNNMTGNNQLYIANDLYSFNNVTINNLLTNHYIIIPNIPSYLTNKDAALAGLPNGSLYRTGNVINIKTNVIIITGTMSSLLQLSGNSTLTISTNTYIEPGIITYDGLKAYIVSIKSINSGIDYINNAIEVSQNLSITSMSLLPPGIYTISYLTRDISNYISTIPRTLNINPAIIKWSNRYNYTVLNNDKDIELNLDVFTLEFYMYIDMRGMDGDWPLLSFTSSNAIDMKDEYGIYYRGGG